MRDPRVDDPPSGGRLNTVNFTVRSPYTPLSWNGPGSLNLLGNARATTLAEILAFNVRMLTNVAVYHSYVVSAFRRTGLAFVA